MQQFTSLHLTVVFIPHHLLMIQLKQLADFVLIEITPLEGVLDYHKKLLIGLLLGVGNYEINYNIEIRMYNFSRKLVVFFIIFFAQSSLGTNAIQLESQNLWNEKAQNGYVKLSNDETGSITFIGTVSPAGGGSNLVQRLPRLQFTCLFLFVILITLSKAVLLKMLMMEMYILLHH